MRRTENREQPPGTGREIMTACSMLLSPNFEGIEDEGGKNLAWSETW